ncbi:MAG: TonB family protein [Myxococcales bacterium]|nr:TonB family protein [Myxococcales bacterium]
MARDGESRILRVGIIQGGRLLEERLLRKRQTVTLGQSPRNTFVVPSPGVPKSVTLFEVHGGAYHLHFRAGMNGKLTVDGAVLDFRALREQKIAKREGDGYAVKLGEQSRGKVLLDDLTVLFQFVAPPPTVAAEALPIAMRGSISRHIEWPFINALLFSFVVQVFSIAFIVTRDYPEQPHGLDALPDRFVDFLITPTEEKPKPTDQEKKDDQVDKEKEKEKEPEEAPKPKERPEPRPAETPEQQAKRKAEDLRRMQKQVRDNTILKFLGSKGGEGPGTIVDTLKDGATDVALADAFAGTGLTVAGADDTNSRKVGEATGDVAGLDEGALKGSRGGPVKTGDKGQEVAVKGALKLKEPTEAIGTGTLDSATIESTIRRRQGALLSCYERQLKRNPKLSGKVEVQVTILESGRADDVRVLENATGDDEVAKCVLSKVARWRFPKPDGGSVTTSFSFFFSPSS